MLVPAAFVESNFDTQRASQISLRIVELVSRQLDSPRGYVGSTAKSDAPAAPGFELAFS